MTEPRAAHPRSMVARHGLLRTVLSASEAVPRPLAALIAAALIALLVTVEVPPAGPLPAIPAYYLVPILILAWFVGWRSAIVGAAAAAAVSVVSELLTGAHASSGLLIHLARVATILAAVLLARAAYVGRLMLDFYFRGEAWRALQKPIEVGEKLVIVPVDGRDNVPQQLLGSDRTALLIQPGMAFGTASHPTTKMCLELLESRLNPGDRVLDLGTGTGILAIAAAKLGAGSVTAVDVDPDAVEVAAGNLDRNGISGLVELSQGSLDAVHSGLVGADSLETAPQANYQLVVANLLAGILRELFAAGLRKVLAPGGTLIVSGIREDELQDFQAGVGEFALDFEQIEQRGGWAACVLRAT